MPLEDIYNYIVRLESGEKIAKYISRVAPPKPGEMINLTYLDHHGSYEVLAVTIQPFIEDFQLFILKVRPVTQ
jgi:hypothetical protein